MFVSIVIFIVLKVNQHSSTTWKFLSYNNLTLILHLKLLPQIHSTFCILFIVYLYTINYHRELLSERLKLDGKALVP